MIFILSYLISIGTTLFTIFYRHLIESDIPPNYTTEEVDFVFKCILISFLLWLVTIFLAKKVGHYVANISFVSVNLLFWGYGFWSNKVHFIYYTKYSQSMDISIILLLTFVLALSLSKLFIVKYKIKKRI